MADQGFTFEDILPPGVSSNVPPRMNESGQLTENKRTMTRRIASVRIYVESFLFIRWSYDSYKLFAIYS